WPAARLAALGAPPGCQRRAGLEAERLASRACRELEPRLSPRVRGGILVPRDHQAHNRALVRALLRACERSGVHLLPTRVRRVLTGGGRVAGALLADGERLAAGAARRAARFRAWGGRGRGRGAARGGDARPRGRLLVGRGRWAGRGRAAAGAARQGPARPPRRAGGAA